MEVNNLIARIHVRVEDWSRLRLVENRGDKVAMEIALVSCSHCGTCSRRMDAVTGRVHRAGLSVQWERIGGGHLIVIPLPYGVDPIRHLRLILGLRIEKC